MLYFGGGKFEEELKPRPCGANCLDLLLDNPVVEVFKFSHNIFFLLIFFKKRNFFFGWFREVKKRRKKELK